MTQVIQIGPFAWSLPLLLAFAAIGLGFAAGGRSGRAIGVDAGAWLWRTLLVGIVVARLAYVWQWQDAYLREPISILDLRDGGWDVGIGGAAAFLYALTVVKRRPQAKRPLMAAGIVAAAIGVLGTIGLAFWPAGQSRLPAVDLLALDGGSVSLRSFEGKPVVLNLWATWCAPCRREMPVLEQAQVMYPELAFLFVNQGEAADRIEAFLRAEKLVLRNVLRDERLEASKEFGRLALPTTLFFDAKGRLVSSRIGELSAATLEQRLTALRRNEAPPQ